MRSRPSSCIVLDYNEDSNHTILDSSESKLRVCRLLKEKTILKCVSVSGRDLMIMGALLSVGPPFTPEMSNWSLDRVAESGEIWKKECDRLFNSFAHLRSVTTGEL
jgi:hypothetical protein